MREALERNGYATIDSISSRDGLVSLASGIGDIVFHPEADPDGVLVITPDPSKVIGPTGFTFSQQAIPLHTDGPGVASYKGHSGPAHLLMLWYKQPQESGGLLEVSDGLRIYQTLQDENPELLEFLQQSQSGDFVTMPDHRYTGPVVESRDKMKIRFKSLGPDNHWDRWRLDEFVEALDQHKTVVPVAPGDLVILDNRRMLHGRTELDPSQERELHHVLVYTSTNGALGSYSSGFEV